MIQLFLLPEQLSIHSPMLVIYQTRNLRPIRHNAFFEQIFGFSGFGVIFLLLTLFEKTRKLEKIFFCNQGKQRKDDAKTRKTRKFGVF